MFPPRAPEHVCVHAAGVVALRGASGQGAAVVGLLTRGANVRCRHVFCEGAAAPFDRGSSPPRGLGGC